MGKALLMLLLLIVAFDVDDHDVVVGEVDQHEWNGVEGAVVQDDEDEDGGDDDGGGVDNDIDAAPPPSPAPRDDCMDEEDGTDADEGEEVDGVMEGVEGSVQGKLFGVASLLLDWYC